RAWTTAPRSGTPSARAALSRPRLRADPTRCGPHPTSGCCTGHGQLRDLVRLPLAGPPAARTGRRAPAGDPPAEHPRWVQLRERAQGPARLLPGRPGRDAARLPRRPVPVRGRQPARPWAVGLMFAAPSAGALAITVVSGWMGRVRRHGVAIAVSAATRGLLITGFGLAPDIVTALGLLVLAGAADMVSGIFRATLCDHT